MQTRRFSSIDVTRGIVMIIMALDHVREFMHRSSMSASPTDLKTTTAALFFTRWITHICAPSFVLLSGMASWISSKKQNSLKASRLFLLKRGLWLILLELTLVNFALWFDIRFRLEILEVIWAIGSGFIILSLMLPLSSRTIGISGIVIIFFHNILQNINFTGFLKTVSLILLKPGFIISGPHFNLLSSYPVLPWTGIMLLGYGCGEFFERQQKERKKIFLYASLLSLALFAVIRIANLYGDPVRWMSQKSLLFTFLSFLNTTKYPPSLLFTLLFTEIKENRITSALEVYGRVPLFYFIIHLYIIHLLMFVMLLLQGFHVNDFIFGMLKNGRPDTGGGVSLGITYATWAMVVILMYPLCRWYARVKFKTGAPGILRYL